MIRIFIYVCFLFFIVSCSETNEQVLEKANPPVNKKKTVDFAWYDAKFNGIKSDKKLFASFDSGFRMMIVRPLFRGLPEWYEYDLKTHTGHFGILDLKSPDGSGNDSLRFVFPFSASYEELTNLDSIFSFSNFDQAGTFFGDHEMFDPDVFVLEWVQGENTHRIFRASPDDDTLQVLVTFLRERFGNYAIYHAPANKSEE